MWLTDKYLRAVAFVIAFVAYVVLWDLTGLPNPLSSHNYALLALKLFSLMGLLLGANLVIGWCARRLHDLRQRSHKGS